MRTLEVSSLSRVYEHTKKRNIAAISASRSEYSPEENKKRTKELREDIRKAGFGFIKIKGRFIENQGTENEKPVDEDVCLIIGDDSDLGKRRLKKMVQALGTKYEQESILYKPFDSDDAELIETVGENKGQITNIGVWHPNKVGQYFSVMKHGNTFVFSPKEKKQRPAFERRRLKKTAEGNWFYELTDDAQEEYLEKYPNSKYKHAANLMVELKAKAKEKIELASDPDLKWWHAQTEEFRKGYVKKHPRSKYAIYKPKQTIGINEPKVSLMEISDKEILKKKILAKIKSLKKDYADYVKNYAKILSTPSAKEKLKEMQDRINELTSEYQKYK